MQNKIIAQITESPMPLSSSIKPKMYSSLAKQVSYDFTNQAKIFMDFFRVFSKKENKISRLFNNAVGKVLDACDDWNPDWQQSFKKAMLEFIELCTPEFMREYVKDFKPKVKRMACGHVEATRKFYKSFCGIDEPIKINFPKLIKLAAVHTGTTFDKIGFSYEGSKLPAFRGKEGLLFRMFVNLLKNSMEAAISKYADQDIRSRKKLITEISVRGRQYRGKLIFEVSDNGTGMSRKAVTAFKKGVAYTSKMVEGSLGLRLVRRAAKEHGGRVYIKENHPGKGVTIAVELPINY